MTPRRLLVTALLLALTPALGCSRDDAAEPADPHGTSSAAAHADKSGRATPAPELTLEQIVPGLKPAGTPYRAPGSSQPPTGALTVTVPRVGKGPSWRSSNVGLSFEMSELSSDLWEPSGSPLKTLLTGLRAPALRFGGNSVDRRVFWTSRGEESPEWAKTTLTPEHLTRLARMAEATDASVSLVLDLGHNDPARAADFAVHAHRALGKRLVGITVGNEPNGYAMASQPQLKIRDADWTPQTYVAQLRTYEKALHAKVPDAPLIGPGTFDAAWWRAFLAADLPKTRALSMHWYPLWSCPHRKGATDSRATPTVTNAVAPYLHDKARRMVSPALAAARKQGLPLWMEETGISSCPGTAPSATHAHALWHADFTMHLAALGVTRAAMHSSLADCPKANNLSALCSTERQGKSGVRGRASMLGLIFAAQLPEGPVASVPTGDPAVLGYTVHQPDGIHLVLVNLHDPTSAGPAPLRLTQPAGYRVAGASVLAGESLAARTGNTLVPMVDVTPGAVRTVAAGSAVMLRLEPAAG